MIKLKNILNEDNHIRPAKEKSDKPDPKAVNLAVWLFNWIDGTGVTYTFGSNINGMPRYKCTLSNSDQSSKEILQGKGNELKNRFKYSVSVLDDDKDIQRGDVDPLKYLQEFEIELNIDQSEAARHKVSNSTISHSHFKGFFTTYHYKSKDNRVPSFTYELEYGWNPKQWRFNDVVENAIANWVTETWDRLYPSLKGQGDSHWDMYSVKK